MLVIVVGSQGRLGKKVIEVLESLGHDYVPVDASFDENDEFSISSIQNINREIVKSCNAIIEFGKGNCALMCADFAHRFQIPLISASTGISKDDEAAIREYATHVPIVRDSNFSIGINVIDKLLSEFVIGLAGYDIAIHEDHHNKKADGPSGTANRLIKTIEDAGGKIAQATFHRIGDEPGTHEIKFAGEMETITIIHRARDPKVFAIGAVKAAQWATTAQPGLYTMNDVLFGLS